MLIATSHKVFVWESASAGAPRPIAGPTERKVLALAQRPACRFVALDGHLLVDRDQREQTFDLGLDESIASLVCLADGQVLGGTVGAHLYRLHVESGRAERIESFDELACRHGWYTPWGGPPAIRSLATSGRTVYADIHVGSIMRSEDDGDTWEQVAATLHEDVHQVVTSPAAPDHVYANTANAVYISLDRGRSWSHRCRGISARYGRAIAVDPSDPDCLLASASQGPHGGDGRLYHSQDGGDHWTHVTAGFPPSCAGNIDTFQVAFDRHGDAWAVVGDELYCSRDRGQSWSVAWRAPAPIKQICCA